MSGGLSTGVSIDFEIHVASESEAQQSKVSMESISQLGLLQRFEQTYEEQQSMSIENYFLTQLQKPYTQLEVQAISPPVIVAAVKTNVGIATVGEVSSPTTSPTAVNGNEIGSGTGDSDSNGMPLEAEVTVPRR